MLRAVADRHTFRIVDDGGGHLVINIGMDIEPLRRDADLAAVLERRPEERWRRGGDIDIRHDNGGQFLAAAIWRGADNLAGCRVDDVQLPLAGSPRAVDEHLEIAYDYPVSRHDTAHVKSVIAGS